MSVRDAFGRLSAPEDALFVVGLVFFWLSAEMGYRFAAGVAAGLVIVAGMTSLGRLWGWWG